MVLNRLKTSLERLRGQSGATLAEFAIVAAFVLFPTIALIAQGGMLMSSWLAITNGAREGARYAAPCINREVEGCNESDVRAKVMQTTAGLLDQSAGRFKVFVDHPIGSNAVTVTVVCTVTNVSPIPGFNDIQLSAESVMRTEVQK